MEHSFTIHRNENSRYKLDINKTPNESEIINIEEPEYEKFQALISEKRTEFGVDLALRISTHPIEKSYWI